MYPIYAYGSEEQKQKYLPEMANGEIIGCFGLTEPDFGSNPGGMITRADKLPAAATGSTARKRWITNGNIAHIAIVWAKLDGEIRGFLVPTDTKGFTAAEDRGQVLAARERDQRADPRGRRGRPKTRILPNVPRASRARSSCLTQARCGIAFGAIGAAMACYEMRARTTPRTACSSAGRSPAISSCSRSSCTWSPRSPRRSCSTLRLGAPQGAEEVQPVQVSLAKRNNCFHALEIARMARDILGGNGIMYEYPISRHMLNLETVYTYEGTHDIHTLIIGQDITGISAFG